jgi:hypothetical protein
VISINDIPIHAFSIFKRLDKFMRIFMEKEKGTINVPCLLLEQI